MIHLRLIVPAAAHDAVVGYLRADPRATHLVVLDGAAVEPAGDLVLVDVAREAATDVLERLRGLGLDDRGAVAIETVDAAPSVYAARAEAAAPGSPDDGIVWDLVVDRAQADARSSWSYYAFLCLATTIAAVAVVTDSAILVVGAMVVGPEFGPVAALAVGIVLRRPRLVIDSLRLLLLGFAVAVAVTAAVAFVARVLGWIEPADLLAPRPLTAFIWRPDRWSVVVSLLAGFAGVLSLTAGRSNALVGVFISVTTVPAAGNLALALALWVPEEIGGAALQLDGEPRRADRRRDPAARRPAAAHPGLGRPPRAPCGDRRRPVSEGGRGRTAGSKRSDQSASRSRTTTASPSAISRAWSASAASTMTRTSGSVPEGRSSTRPVAPSFGLGSRDRRDDALVVRRPGLVDALDVDEHLREPLHDRRRGRRASGRSGRPGRAGAAPVSSRHRSWRGRA